ncbi:MAG TPA: hypothetical protein VIL92_07805 [Gaiellaceae bacterium]
MKPFVVIALVAFLAAGCGGGSTNSSVYTLAATKQCIETKLGVHKFPALGDDFVASTASGGAVRIRLADNAVTVLFGESANEANNLADAYRRFHAKNVGVEDILRTKGNAVLLWQLHPSAPDESNVEDCLK